MAANNTLISQEFIRLYEVQFTMASDTLDIHCNVTQLTAFVINTATGGIRRHLLLCGVVLMTVLTL
jgi:hypothetical protein